MTITLPDLSSVEAWKGGGILPPGKHTCRITDARDGTSSGGHPQIEIEWEAVEGEHAGSSIREWVVITERSLGKIRALLDAIQFQVPAGAFQLDVTALVGKRATITVVHEPDRVDPAVKRSRVVAHDQALGDWRESIGSGHQQQAVMAGEKPLPF